MRLEAFRVEDLDRFANYGGQEDLVERMPREAVRDIVQRGNHYSVFHDAEIIACFGFVPVHEWRATAWSLLQSGRPRLFAPLHIVIKRVLLQQPWPRIEVHVDPASLVAVRWVELLGFIPETWTKPYFFPDGRPASEWVFLKEAG